MSLANPVALEEADISDFTTYKSNANNSDDSDFLTAIYKFDLSVFDGLNLIVDLYEFDYKNGSRQCVYLASNEKVTDEISEVIVQADHIRQIYFSIKDKDGMVFGRGKLVLEPGDTLITFAERFRYRVDGGRYYERVFNSWLGDDEFKFNLKELRRINKSIGDRTWTEEERALSREISKRASKVRSDKLSPLLDGGGAVEKLLIAQQDSILSLNEAVLLLEELSADLPNNPGRKAAYLFYKDMLEAETIRDSLVVGATAPDFKAPNIEGNDVRLTDIMRDSRYTLVEFWASWCSPCRGEIPYLKSAYSTYRSKGFEIVSFSIDDDREEWLEASEEVIPWINTSDLKGRASSVAKSYGVDGVPCNYLVDGEDGTIIAKNLRRDKLSIKLAELLSDAPAAVEGHESQAGELSERIDINALELDDLNDAVKSMKVMEPTAERPVSVEAMIVPAIAVPGSKVAVVIKAKLKHGWHLYAYDPSKTFKEVKHEVSPCEGVKVIGDWILPETDAYMADPDVLIYSGELIFIQTLKLSEDIPSGEKTISLRFSFQTCDLYHCMQPLDLELNLKMVVE